MRLFSNRGQAVVAGGATRLWLSFALSLLVLLTLPAARVLAFEAPVFSRELYQPHVYANRAYIEVRVQSGEFKSDGNVLLPMTWRSEYATSLNGPWTPSASGKNEQEGPVQEIFLGSKTGHEYADALVRDLEPEKRYFARFHAANECEAGRTCESEHTYEFTTTPIGKPEVYGNQFGELEGSPGLFVGAEQLAQTSFGTGEVLVESDGAQTEYHFEYAPAEGGNAPSEGSAAWVPFTSGGSGSISVAEEFAATGASVTGLTPETSYFARVRASNAKGTTVALEPFTTETAKASTDGVTVANVTGETARLEAEINPHGSQTEWRFEYSTSPGGPWLAVPGGEGVVSQAQAEKLATAVSTVESISARLGGLSASTTYYVRVFLKNAAGEGEVCGEKGCESISGAKQGVAEFRTVGPPSVSTFAVHGLVGEALRVIGQVDPNSTPTSGEQTITVEGAPTGGSFTLTFKGSTTTPLPFDATGSEVQNALGKISAGVSSVAGPPGGPYDLLFAGQGVAGTAQPAVTADASGLTPAGSVSVSVVNTGGEAPDTHYYFEYVSQRQFEASGGEGGFAKAAATAPEDLGEVSGEVSVGADLPALTAGETYRFRLVATNTSPGDPVVRGEEQSLTVPVAPAGEAEAGSGCPNESLRSGLSARLPDCRAYELLTPLEKEGTAEIFNYGGTFEHEDAFPGEDGEHLELGASPVKWGSGQSPYFFTRGEDGWGITAATVQPEAGARKFKPQLLGPDLDQAAFEVTYKTSPSSVSPEVEYDVGPPGGPYVTAARVPHADVSAQIGGGWVGASGDFSKLILETADHTLLGHSTHTSGGEDLYEYAGGQLRQLNVTGASPGTTISTCGAVLAGGAGVGDLSSIAPVITRHVAGESHPVSADGSHVFFETCTGLYMRVDGSETVDLGSYQFIAANKEGSEALLEKSNGENPGLYLYKTGSAPEFLPSSGVAVTINGNKQLTVSEDLSTVYIRAAVAGDAVALYRYDISAGQIAFITDVNVTENAHYAASPDGRYLYFRAQSVSGMPAGTTLPGSGGSQTSTQVFRYDSEQQVVQCLSCASAFDPDPKLSAVVDESGAPVASANGDYVFFDTPAALLPSDVDGEIEPEGSKNGSKTPGELTSPSYSLSSDVYEWRRDGLDGCVHAQGCLALITSGGGGYLNILLGTDASGRDVFFTTSESLVSSDRDTAMDIYDARVGGGFAEPARPVECEGDACSTPFAAPSDLTPSSSTFQGAGDLVPAATPTPKATKPKPKKKVVKKKPKKKKKGKKVSRKAKKSAKGRK